MLCSDALCHLINCVLVLFVFFFKQKTAYEMRISDWSSDVCSSDLLVLGPFQGKAACIRIALDKGVCGAAARLRATQRVDDVLAFPGYIACDADSRSELVVPVIADDRLVGGLDLDSPNPARFPAADQAGAEAPVAHLAAAPAPPKTRT